MISGAMANRGDHIDAQGSQQGRWDAGGYYYINSLPEGYYTGHEVRIPISQKGDTQLYKDGYNDGFNEGVNDVKANPSNYGLSNGSAYDDGYANGLKYARTTQEGYILVEAYERGESYCRYDTYGIMKGATVTFYGMSDKEKKIVIKNANDNSELYNSGWTSSSSLTYTFTSDADIEIELYSRNGVTQWAHYKFTI